MNEYDGMLVLDWDSDGNVRIDRADPCLVLGEESLLAAYRGDDPGVSLTLGGTGGIGTIEGSVLRITAEGRQVVYHVTEELVPAPPLAEGRCWVCRWPD